MTVGILNHRGTLDTEFSEQALFSDLDGLAAGAARTKKVRA